MKLERENRKVLAAIKERLGENTRLDGQLKDLAGNVGVREAIYKSRVAASSDGGGSAADRKMKRVTMRRKLVDLARAQTDEIEFLRMELDRLRQKTFPSFANAARERVDERTNDVALAVVTNTPGAERPPFPEEQLRPLPEPPGGEGQRIPAECWDKVLSSWDFFHR